MSELGYTQKTLAEKIGISQTAISQLIAGKRPAVLEEAEQMALILRIGDDEFDDYFFDRRIALCKYSEDLSATRPFQSNCLEDQLSKHHTMEENQMPELSWQPHSNGGWFYVDHENNYWYKAANGEQITVTTPDGDTARGWTPEIAWHALCT